MYGILNKQFKDICRKIDNVDLNGEIKQIYTVDLQLKNLEKESEEEVLFFIRLKTEGKN